MLYSKHHSSHLGLILAVGSVWQKYYPAAKYIREMPSTNLQLHYWHGSLKDREKGTFGPYPGLINAYSVKGQDKHGFFWKIGKKKHPNLFIFARLGSKVTWNRYRECTIDLFSILDIPPNLTYNESSQSSPAMHILAHCIELLRPYKMKYWYHYYW